MLTFWPIRLQPPSSRSFPLTAVGCYWFSKWAIYTITLLGLEENAPGQSMCQQMIYLAVVIFFRNNQPLICFKSQPVVVRIKRMKGHFLTCTFWGVLFIYLFIFYSFYELVGWCSTRWSDFSAANGLIVVENRRVCCSGHSRATLLGPVGSLEIH